MAMVRTGVVGAWAAFLACACATHFSSQTPAAVSFAGNWKLNHAASDDPQKVLAKMREEAIKLIKRQMAEVTARTGITPQDPDAPPPAAGPPSPDGAGAGAARRSDPLRRSPMAAIIHALMERGDFLTIRQSADEVVFDYGTVRRSFTPGAHSVVSAEGGVGDQMSGWHDKSYVIQIRPQNGPEVTETYALSPDGKQLLDTVAIAAAELPAVRIRRVYEPTTETAPHNLPATD
ncbi:MAG: hypothetical protein JSR36_12435 [Proteobacteria bacterium]|nr:hypothetical protein [Pseudomonadota bacterium]